MKNVPKKRQTTLSERRGVVAKWSDVVRWLPVIAASEQTKEDDVKLMIDVILF